MLSSFANQNTAIIQNRKSGYFRHLLVAPPEGSSMVETIGDPLGGMPGMRFRCPEQYPPALPSLNRTGTESA
jgi:hypothetical protein